jgi:hypothetical protein
MSTTTVNGLAPKDSYDELTATQAAVVDELASDDADERTDTEIADAVGCSGATVSNVRHSYPHIISRQRISHPEDGSDAGGNADDLDAELGDGEREVQYFSERPVKSFDDDDEEPAGPIAAEDDGPEAETVIDEGMLDDAVGGEPEEGDTVFVTSNRGEDPRSAMQEAFGPPRIDDFVSDDVADRLEAIAEDIMPVGVDQKATVEETIAHLAWAYTLPEETADIRE